MNWELEFIRWLQSHSSPFFDYLIYIFTQFGAEILFMLAVMILYWCIDKREGYRLINVFMLSQLVVGLIKVTVKRVRPFYLEGIRPILEQTAGYAFPSGHSNNIAVICTDVCLAAKNKWTKAFRTVVIISCFLVPVVMFSRVYLGQHYPTDVIVGGMIGVGIGILGYWLFDLLADREEKLMLVILPLCAVLLGVGIYYYIVNGDAPDAIVKAAGAYAAVSVGYYLEKKKVRYCVKSERIWKYFVRFLLGAFMAIVLKEGLKAIFNLFAHGVWSLVLTEFARYFILGIFATLFAPMIFKKLKI